MTRDVYADDDGFQAGPGVIANGAVHIIQITADPSPDLLLRIAVALNSFNELPQSMRLRRSDDQAQIGIWMRGPSLPALELVRRKLAQLTCVIDVSISRGQLPNLPPHLEDDLRRTADN